MSNEFVTPRNLVISPNPTPRNLATRLCGAAAWSAISPKYSVKTYLREQN